MYSGYGLDKLATIVMGAESWDALANASTFIARLQANIADRNDGAAYLHFPNGNPETDAAKAGFIQIIDFLQAQAAAGNCEVLSVPAGMTKSFARLPIA
jgi:hypothetical protein